MECVPEHYNSRSQDLPEVIMMGQFVGKSQDWKNKPGGFSQDNTIIELPNLVQDIDTMMIGIGQKNL